MRTTVNKNISTNPHYGWNRYATFTKMYWVLEFYPRENVLISYLLSIYIMSLKEGCKFVKIKFEMSLMKRLLLIILSREKLYSHIIVHL